MKSYTDLEQSKKLAEILSLESADMHWQYIEEDNGQLQWFCFPKDFSINQHNKVSAWSLAALLDVIPLEVETHKQTDGHKIYYYVESYMKRNGKEIYQSTERHENLIDACYEMIIRLNKLKLV